MAALKAQALASQFGTIYVQASNKGVTALTFEKSELSPTLKETPASRKICAETIKHLKSYLAGNLSALSKIKLDPQGTPFQQKAWKALTRITPGKTASYGDIARKIGSPKAARAVGMACNKNPICLAVPCHRVISSSGKLTGYRGGLKKKQALLRHEGLGV